MRQDNLSIEFVDYTRSKQEKLKIGMMWLTSAYLYHFCMVKNTIKISENKKISSPLSPSTVSVVELPFLVHPEDYNTGNHTLNSEQLPL